MNFVPDEKLLLKCVLNVEGLTDAAAVQIRRTQLRDDVPAKINNTSKVLRLAIEYEVAGEPRKASLVVKIPHLRSESVYEFFKGRQFFVKEVRFYESMAPRMQKMLGRGVAPALFASDERQVLYLDDLCVRGYRIQTDGQLDVEHSEVVVRHLAGMHAASHVLHAAEPQLFDEMVERQFLIGDDFVGKLYVEVRPLLRTLAQVGCLSAEMVGRFDAAVETTKSDISRNLDSGGFEFSVLNHGDLKAHNILFEHDQRGKPVRCSLIDFQICYWSSPMMDIIFYTILSMDREVFRNDFDRLLETYVATMNETLEKQNCDFRLTKAHLRRDWDELKAMKVFSLLFRTIIDIREFCKHFEYATYKEASPEMLEKLSQSADIRDSIRFWLEEFDKTGVF